MKTSSSHTPLVTAEGTGKRFRERTIWHDLSFDVRPGEMLAVRGQSGSGKTTLLNCVGGLERIDQGILRVGGSDITRLSGQTRQHFFRETVGFLFQNYALIDSWTVAQNLEIAIERMTVGKSGMIPKMLTALDRVGLHNILKMPVYTLSGGEQQRVALARLLLKEARVLLADEPTSALDDHNAALLIELLNERCSQGAAVMVSTHDPRMISACSSELSLTTPSAQKAGTLLPK